MGERVGVRELRDGLTAALRRVEAGATIDVTRDGRTIAVLAPAGAGDALEALVDRGAARLPSRPWRAPTRLHPPAER